MLSVVECLKAMSFTVHVSFELKYLNYDSFRIEIVPCISNTFNGDVLFELPPRLVPTIIIIRCKEWIGNMMAMDGTRLRLLTSRTIST